MIGRRRLSEAISEGEGISLLAHVARAADATVAEQRGAAGVLLEAVDAEVRDTTSLPVLVRGGTPPDAGLAVADAWLLVAETWHGEESRLEELYESVEGLGLECVVDVRDEEELELVLERIDPEILLLSPRDADEDEERLDRILALLPDVPAGKLAIAELREATREDILTLERAGIDAVLVGPDRVAALAGGPLEADPRR